MKKKLTALTALIFFVLVLLLSACTTDPNDKITVATIDGEKITKTDYLYEWEYIKSYYGITDDMLVNADYKDQLDELRQSVLEYVVQNEISRIELKNLGYYDLSEDESASVTTSVETVLANALASMETEMYEELGDDYSEKDLAKAQLKYTQLALEEYGIDEEYIKDYYTYEIAMTNAENDLLDLTVTDEEVEALFDEWVQGDKDLFQDISAYEYYYQAGYDVYYTPEGYRNVRQVLIAFDDETQEQIQTLRSDGDDEAADELVKTSLEAIYEEALDVYALVNNGEITFDEAIEQYNDDTGMDYYPEGYQVSLETTYYVQEFTDAAMALENVGDISELVGTDYGYHILEYYSDVASGASDIELYRDELTSELLEEKRTEGWTALLEEWAALHEIEYFYDQLTEDIEVATDEPTEEATEDAGTDTEAEVTATPDPDSAG